MNIIDTALETSWESFLRMTGKDPAAIEEQFQQRFSGISPGYDRIVFPSPPLAPDFVEALVMASQTVLACIASIPERIFANDVAAWLKFQGLDPEEILVVGDLTRSWQRFGPVISKEVEAQILRGGRTPRVVPVHEGGLARLRGTVALVLQKHFTAAALD